jgi:hypothetical protein
MESSTRREILRGRAFSNFRDGQIGENRNFLTWDETLEAARAVGVGDVHPFASSPHRLTLR